MLIPVVTFIGVAAIILVMYWLFDVRVERAGRRALQKRFKSDRGVKVERRSLLKEIERLSTVKMINGVLTRHPRAVSSLQRLIRQSGVRTTVGRTLLGSACLFMLVYLAVFWLTRYVGIGVLLGAIASSLPVLSLKRARAKRVARFEELFPEAIDLISRSLRAGHAFTSGLAMVADEMPAPISTEFRALYDRQNYGMPLPDALREFAERIPLLDARFFVTAILTQREAGGNLAEVLDNLGSVIRVRFAVKREVRTKSAHGRLTGWILAGMPPCVALGLLVLSPGNMMMLVRDPLGVQMIVTALVLQVIGTLVIRRIVDIEI